MLEEMRSEKDVEMGDIEVLCSFPHNAARWHFQLRNY